MLAESIHSVVDISNEILLLFGIHRSKRQADEQHPFGYGKEIYFWGLIVALLLFAVGGGMSIYEGITHIEHPVEINDPSWNYLVLGIALVADSSSWVIGFRQMLKRRQQGETIWQMVRGSKDPSIFIVLGEDTADVLGILVAFGGVFLSHQLNNPLIDGAASIVIGIILITVAIFLTSESKSLIVGESANMALVQHIRELAEADPAIKKVRRLLTMQFGPNQILVNIDLQFQTDLSSSEIFTTINRIEQSIQKHYPEATQIFVEAKSFKVGGKQGN
jgi:cation diffusion facilitator family transporter